MTEDDVPCGPYYTFCPACEVDNSSDKVVTTIGRFQNHVFRHMRRVPPPYPLGPCTCGGARRIPGLIYPKGCPCVYR